MIRDWRVSLKRSFSDHRRILFGVNYEVPKRKPFMNPRKTNLETFSKLVRVSLGRGRLPQTPKHPTVEEIELAVKQLGDALVKAFRQFMLDKATTQKHQTLEDCGIKATLHRNEEALQKCTEK